MADEETQESQEQQEATLPEIWDYSEGEERPDGTIEGEETATEEAEEPPKQQDAAPPAKEEKQEEPKQEPQLPDAVQRAYEDIQRRDAALRQREQEYKQAQAELAELKSKAREREADPAAYFESLLGPDEKVKELEQNPVVRNLKSELESVKKQQTEYQQRVEQERQRQAQVQVYNEYVSHARKVDPEKYPHVAQFADKLAPDYMFGLAAQYAQQQGRLPEIGQLTEAIEERLKNEANELISKLAGIGAYRDRFAGQNGEQEKQAQQTQAPSTPRTLSNKMTAEPPAAARKPDLDPATATPDDWIRAGMAAYKTAERDGEE